MGLEALLTRLESRAVTAVTAAETAAVTAKPAPSLACTPVTPVTAPADVKAASPAANDSSPPLADAIPEFDAGLPGAQSNAHAADRTCTGCAHRLRPGTCAEPVAAGLTPRFGIIWPEPAHAATCPAFSSKVGSPAPATPQDRPYKLTVTEGDLARAESWDEGSCARFEARASRLLELGFNGDDADDLAERLHLRDVQFVGRVLCVECRHLVGRDGTGWRCGNPAADAATNELPVDHVTTLQWCGGFAPC